MECPSCKTTQPEGSVWCLTCGIALEQSSSESQVSDRQTILAQADRLTASGQYQEAIALLTQWVVNTPPAQQHAIVYRVLGDLQRRLGNDIDALQAYKQAVILNPSDENRQRFDAMIDQLRRIPLNIAPAASKPVEQTAPTAHPTQPQPAVRPEDEVLEIPVTTFIASWFKETFANVKDAVPKNENGETISLLATMRSWVTPQRVRVVVGLAVVMLLISLTIVLKPWLHRHRSATRVTPINAVQKIRAGNSSTTTQNNAPQTPATSQPFQSSVPGETGAPGQPGAIPATGTAPAAGQPVVSAAGGTNATVTQPPVSSSTVNPGATPPPTGEGTLPAASRQPPTPASGSVYSPTRPRVGPGRRSPTQHYSKSGANTPAQGSPPQSGTTK